MPHHTTVLLVDDDRDTREMYGLVLSMAGWTVCTAGTVRDAMRLADAHRPAVIVCDWRLPDGDGTDVARSIRRITGMGRTPIIAVTGVAMTPDLRNGARRVGIHAILEKPALPDRVSTAVQEAAEWRRARDLRAAIARVCRSAAMSRREPVSASAALQPEAASVVKPAPAVAGAPVAIMIANDFGKYVAANANATKLTGYPVPDLLSLSVWDLTPEPRAQQGRQAWEHFIRSGCQEGTYVLLRRDGRQVAAQYCAIANVTPGLHLSALMPAGAGAA